MLNLIAGRYASFFNTNLTSEKVSMSMGVGRGGQEGGVAPPDFHTWYFQYFLLFFGLFSVAPPHPPGKSLIVLFSVFFYFSVFSFVAPLPGNFSADALAHVYKITSFCAPVSQ